MAKKQLSCEVFNLVGLGINFHTSLSKSKERNMRKETMKQIIEERQYAYKLDSEDFYCIICGAEVDLKNLSCKGCGMEFNMDPGEARHMISLMIGIFWCDGVLDEREQACLQEYLQRIGDISPVIKKKLKKEINSPRKLKNITRWIKTPQGKRNTLRLAVASGMVSEWGEEELKYLEEAKKLLKIDPEEANKVMKKARKYLEPLIG